MFNTLSILIHLINSIFSGLYISQFLKSKLDKKLTISLWLVIYFALQVAIFDVLYSQYPFNNMVGAIINVILLIGIQLIFFRREILSQLFVSFSFVAGKEIVKYVVSVANFALGAFIGKWINALVMQGKIATDKVKQFDTFLNLHGLLDAFMEYIRPKTMQERIVEKKELVEKKVKAKEVDVKRKHDIAI